MEHDEALLTEWAQSILDEQIAAGRGPVHPKPWLEATKRDLATNSPEYVERVVNGIRARANGQRLTGWRLTRGTHGIDYIEDPNGKDTPPYPARKRSEPRTTGEVVDLNSRRTKLA